MSTHMLVFVNGFQTVNCTLSLRRMFLGALSPLALYLPAFPKEDGNDGTKTNVLTRCENLRSAKARLGWKGESAGALCPGTPGGQG